MPADATKKFINHYSVISAEEGARRQEAIEADKLASEAARLLEATNFTDPSDFLSDQNTGNVIPDTCTDMDKADNNVTKQGSPKGSKKATPANSGKTSPKESPEKATSKPTSPKKVPSRKGSVTNGENTVQKCKDTEEKTDSVGKTVTANAEEATRT